MGRGIRFGNHVTQGVRRRLEASGRSSQGIDWLNNPNSWYLVNMSVRTTADGPRPQKKYTPTQIDMF